LLHDFQKMTRSITLGKHDVSAVVVAVLTQDTITIKLLPGVGMLDGRIPIDIPIEMVPFELRLPNTRLIVTMTGGCIVSVRSGNSDK
jgi:hypothetical protein